MNEIVEQKEKELQTKPDAMALIGQALQSGTGVEHMDKLIELVKFNDSREALKAFNSAFTLAQAEFPRVQKTKKAHNSNYAPFADVVKQITPVLINHGLSFRHGVKESETGVSVTCILAHKDGHSEQATITAPPDDSGKKNKIQSIGSAITYLKRYTFEAVTGVVTTDDDDDAISAGKETITEEQAIKIDKLIVETETDIEAVLARYNVSTLEGLNINQYGQAMAILEGKKK